MRGRIAVVMVAVNAGLHPVGQLMFAGHRQRVVEMAFMRRFMRN
jgi:hypothetical protein